MFVRLLLGVIFLISGPIDAEAHTVKPIALEWNIQICQKGQESYYTRRLRDEVLWYTACMVALNHLDDINREHVEFAQDFKQGLREMKEEGHE